MSTTYTDLTETQFPDKVDDLSRMSDLTVSDVALVNQYYTYYNAGNLAAAAQLLIDNPTLMNKIFNAAKFNILRDALIALQRYYKSDVQTYIDSTRDSLQGEIDSGMSAIRNDMAILDARIRAEKISSIHQSLIKQNESQEGDIYNTMKDEALFRLKPLRGFDKIVNFRVNDSGFLEKRPGTRQAVTMPDNIRGALTVSTVGGDLIYVVAGSTLYRILPGETLSSESIGSLTGAAFSSDSERVEMFMFAGKLCILAGGEYFVSDGASLERVGGYVPLIAKNINHLGVGESFERLNLLTNQVRARFIADGTTHDYTLNYKIVSVDAVYVAGTLIPRSEYTVSIYTTYTAVHTSAVYSSPNGGDIVEIFFTLNRTSQRSRVTSCTKAAAYGKDTDTRVFLYGGSEQSTLFPSEPSGADDRQTISYDYFPAGAQITVGDGKLPICGACKQSGNLVLFTPNAAFYIRSEDSTLNNISTQVFVLNLLNQDFGATAGGAVKCGNAMYFIANDSLYFVNSIMPVDQTQFIKKTPPEYLEFRANSEALKIYANKTAGEIWCYGIDDKIAIYNINKECWYQFEGFAATGIFSYDGVPWFYQGNKIYSTSPTIYTDSNVNYTAYCETDWIDFGNTLAAKRIRRLGIKVGAGDVARVLTAKLTASCEPIKAAQSLVESSKQLSEVDLTFDIPAVASPIICMARGQIGKLCCVKMCITSSNDAQPCQIEEVAMMVAGANTVVLRSESDTDGSVDSGSEDESIT